MPLNPQDYRHHGGGNYVAVIRCPNIAGPHLVHLSQAGQGSWVLRDYISGEQLFRSPPPNRSVSGLSLADIEAAADHSEPPPFFPEHSHQEWRGYLLLRSMVAFNLRHAPAPAGANRPVTTPPSQWQPL
jgi:hypothetical protein